jgi:WD40 repeat protein
MAVLSMKKYSVPVCIVVALLFHGQCVICADDSLHRRSLQYKEICRQFDDARCIEVSPCAMRVAVAYNNRTVHIYDLETQELLRTLEGNEGPVCTLRFIEDGSKLVGDDTSGHRCVWDVARGTLLCTSRVDRPLIEERLNPGEASQYGFAKGEGDRVLSPDRSRRIEIHPATHAPFGELLRRPQVCIYDNKNGNIVDQFFLPMDHVDLLVMTHDGSKLAATEDSTALYWEGLLFNEKRAWRFMSCNVVIFDVQKKSVVCSFWLYNKRLKYVPCSSSSHSHEPYPRVLDMFFSHDGSKLIIKASPERTHFPFRGNWGAVIYDASTGQRLRVLPLGLGMRPLEFSSDCLKIVNYSATQNSLHAFVWKDKRVQQKALALACALHERLGAHSPAHLLDPYTLRNICLMGLPADAFGSEPTDAFGSEPKCGCVSRCVIS